YRVAPRSPIVDGCPEVQPRDLLLIDADEKRTRQWGAVLGKICTFRLGRGRRERVLLGQVADWGNEYFAEFERFGVELFGEPGEHWLIVADSVAGIEAGRRAVSGTCLVMAQVAGVCVLLERPFERQRPEGRSQEEAGH